MKLKKAQQHSIIPLQINPLTRMSLNSIKEKVVKTNIFVAERKNKNTQNERDTVCGVQKTFPSSNETILKNKQWTDPSSQPQLNIMTNEAAEWILAS